MALVIINHTYVMQMQEYANDMQISIYDRIEP